MDQIDDGTIDGSDDGIHTGTLDDLPDGIIDNEYISGIKVFIARDSSRGTSLMSSSWFNDSWDILGVLSCVDVNGDVIDDMADAGDNDDDNNDDDDNNKLSSGLCVTLSSIYVLECISSATLSEYRYYNDHYMMMI